jgi:hypothetical protein
MLPTRQLIVAAIASALIVGWIYAPKAASATQRPAKAHAKTHTGAQGPTGDCEAKAKFAVLSSPAAPWIGAPLRVLVATEELLDSELSLIAPDGKVAAKSHDRNAGPPYSWYAEVESPAAGTWQVKLTRDGAPAECGTLSRDIAVQRKAPPGPRATIKSVWPVRDTWNRTTENLYSAWIEKLFDAPLDTEPSWPALQDVLRDRSRNILFNSLGLREDEKGLVMQPDCADVPYFLRAYFAFKMGLPFGYAKCTRGGGGAPPKCPQWWNIQNEEPPQTPPVTAETMASTAGPFGLFREPVAAPVPMFPPRPQGLVPGFGFYLRNTVANGVQSGNGRTAANDNNSDYYLVPLKAETLRAGTIYADPYGHVLVLVKRVPQTGDGAGVFLAIDGQPDGTVARKRFWRGNFLFTQDPSLGSPGFKRFRPIVRGKNGGLRRLTNDEIANNEDYADFSLEQAKLSVEDFYDRMDDVMSPEPLDPVRALRDTITSLEEQVKTRVTSVENGRKYQAGGGGEVAMPDGASIFETTGAWEDYATPSRDLRLLIAIDVVRGFADRVVRRPERYAMPKDKSVQDVKAELDSVLASELAARKFSYTRSDGSQWELALKDVSDRTPALEMAYNVNDCVELRWGAPDGSDEASTCKRHAPAGQRQKMAADYRAWFHERRRPPRD